MRQKWTALCDEFQADQPGMLPIVPLLPCLKPQILTFPKPPYNICRINGFLGAHSSSSALRRTIGISVFQRRRAPRHNTFLARFFSTITLPTYIPSCGAFKKWSSKRLLNGSKNEPKKRLFVVILIETALFARNWRHVSPFERWTLFENSSSWPPPPDSERIT